VFYDCVPPGSIAVSIPESRVADIAGVKLTGPGCESGTTTCGPDVFECEIVGTKVGGCRVEIRFKSGARPFVIDTTFAMGTDQCPGLYANRPYVVIPTLAQDAGASAPAPAPGPDAAVP
jgi:hypothetical protein